MAIEDHPKFEDWKGRLEALIQATEAYRAGKATEKDVERAREAYNAIADEV